MRWRSTSGASARTSSGTTYGPAAEEGVRAGRLRQRDRGARRAAEGDQRLQLGQADARRDRASPAPGRRCSPPPSDPCTARRWWPAPRRIEPRVAAAARPVISCPPLMRSRTSFSSSRVGIPDPHLEHEAVELGLGQRIGALVLDRVLGGEDHERLLQRIGRAADRDLMLLHRLEQRGLHLGGRAVDLVRQDDLGEERPLLDVELLRSSGRRPWCR